MPPWLCDIVMISFSQYAFTMARLFLIGGALKHVCLFVLTMLRCLFVRDCSSRFRLRFHASPLSSSLTPSLSASFPYDLKGFSNICFFLHSDQCLSSCRSFVSYFCWLECTTYDCIRSLLTNRNQSFKKYALLASNQCRSSMMRETH